MNNATENLVAALRNENGNKQCKREKSHFLFVDSFFGFFDFLYIYGEEEGGRVINWMPCFPNYYNISGSQCI